MIRITIALLLLLAVPANAQDSIPRSGWGASFHDAVGRSPAARAWTQTASRPPDAVGRVTGTVRADSNGVTTFHEAAGRVSGAIQKSMESMIVASFPVAENRPKGAKSCNSQTQPTPSLIRPTPPLSRADRDLLCVRGVPDAGGLVL